MEPEPVQSTSLKELIDGYVTTFEGSTSTIKAYEAIVKKFLRWCETDDIHAVNRLHVIMYLKQNYAQGTPASYNKNLYAIKNFFQYCQAYFALPDPSEKLRARGQDQLPNPRVITLDEYKKIRGQVGQARDIAVFLANTGLRINEFLTMSPERVDFYHKTLEVVGKGAKPRTIPLNTIAAEILSRYQSRLNLRKSRPLQYTHVRRMFERLSRDSGVEHFGPHALRHFFATFLIDSGVPIQVVSNLLGHSSITLTIARYYHIPKVNLDCLEKIL